MFELSSLVVLWRLRQAAKRVCVNDMIAYPCFRLPKLATDQQLDLWSNMVRVWRQHFRWHIPVCIYIYIYIPVYIPVHVYICIYRYIGTGIYIYIYTYMNDFIWFVCQETLEAMEGRLRQAERALLLPTAAGTVSSPPERVRSLSERALLLPTAGTVSSPVVTTSSPGVQSKYSSISHSIPHQWVITLLISICIQRYWLHLGCRSPTAPPMRPQSAATALQMWPICINMFGNQ